MAWITLKTTSFRWEAELMQQLLTAHQSPARILDLGILPYLGAGSLTALQVRSEDQLTALLLLSSPEAEQTSQE